ncbi:MAG: hypothetical protein MJ134_07800 [Lachnospiraceae bacterium]|nr:hypothetical protein [Lachnospiraceae bacterium]
MEKENEKKKLQATKKYMTAILIISLLDMQLPFILAFIGRENIAETLGITVATEIVGVFTVYCLKSFFETKEERKNGREE